MQAAIIQRRDRLEEAMSTAAAATFIGGILLSLGALAVAPILGAVFNDSEVTLLAAAASGLIFVNTLAVVPNAILQRRFSSVRLTVVDPLEVVAFGIVSIALATARLRPMGLGDRAVRGLRHEHIARLGPRKVETAGEADVLRHVARARRLQPPRPRLDGHLEIRRPAGRHRDRRQIARTGFPRPVSLRACASRPCRGRSCRPARGTSSSRRSHESAPTASGSKVRFSAPYAGWSPSASPRACCWCRSGHP